MAPCGKALAIRLWGLEFESVHFPEKPKEKNKYLSQGSVVRWEVETEKAPDAHRPIGLAYAVKKKTISKACLKQDGQLGPLSERLSSDFQISMHTHLHRGMWTHIQCIFMGENVKIRRWHQCWKKYMFFNLTCKIIPQQSTARTRKKCPRAGLEEEKLGLLFCASLTPAWPCSSLFSCLWNCDNNTAQ